MGPVLIASIVLAAIFLIMAVVYGSKVKSVAKNEVAEVKQKRTLYVFGVVFAVGIAIFAKMSGI